MSPGMWLLHAVMVALWNRADHYIFILWFLSIFYLFSSTNLSGYTLYVYHMAYFHTWCGLSANLECRSEMCCKRLAENTGRKKVAKNRLLGTIAQLCRAISSQLRHASTIEKNLLSNSMSCPHSRMNFGPLTAEVGAPQLISTGFASWQRYCTAVK